MSRHCALPGAQSQAHSDHPLPKPSQTFLHVGMTAAQSPRSTHHWSATSKNAALGKRYNASRRQNYYSQERYQCLHIRGKCFPWAIASPVTVQGMAGSIHERSRANLFQVLAPSPFNGSMAEPTTGSLTFTDKLNNVLIMPHESPATSQTRGIAALAIVGNTFNQTSNVLPHPVLAPDLLALPMLAQAAHAPAQQQRMLQRYSSDNSVEGSNSMGLPCSTHTPIGPILRATWVPPWASQLSMTATAATNITVQRQGLRSARAL